MKKILLLILLSLTFTSCTYEDVVNYLQGKPSNLSEEQKNQVDKESQNQDFTITSADIVEKDKPGVNPPQH